MQSNPYDNCKSWNPQAIQDHSDTFQLISNLEGWHRCFYNYYERDSNPLCDRSNKAGAILYATFQMLAEAGQLRVRRFAGYTGLDYNQRWYHEIQILDQNKQVVETLFGEIFQTYNKYTMTHDAFIQSPLEPPNIVRWYDGWMFNHPDVVELLLVLPTTFINYPEFQDENKNILECDYYVYKKEYFIMSILIKKEFITDEFVTEEIREKKIRNHAIVQCRTIKEDLMINRWCPARVERLLLAGYDVEDM